MASITAPQSYATRQSADLMPGTVGCQERIACALIFPMWITERSPI